MLACMSAMPLWAQRVEIELPIALPPSGVFAVASQAPYAVLSRGKDVYLYDLTTGKELAHTSYHATVGALALNADATAAVIAGLDQSSRIWYIERSTRSGKLPRSAHAFSAISYSPCGRWMAMYNHLQGIRVWVHTRTYTKSPCRPPLSFGLNLAPAEITWWQPPGSSSGCDTPRQARSAGALPIGSGM